MIAKQASTFHCWKPSPKESTRPFSPSQSVVGILHNANQSLVGSSSNILHAGMFHVQERSWIFFFCTVMNSGAERTSSVSSRSASRPRSDVEARVAASLNESRSVSDRSAPLVAARGHLMTSLTSPGQKERRQYWWLLPDFYVYRKAVCAAGAEDQPWYRL